ncbi:hypothetical protein Vretifemale_6793 [Volvox reticuliferus]|uniref:FAD-binding domain-containing protein n=1 Tax=Volvox reticuliferus TaxID=1737510 RepID=A0A8J4FI55_9CHLO|nr:hypothetical protein Vretifemale_6793 [Volvox reticuliferus]
MELSSAFLRDHALSPRPQLSSRTTSSCIRTPSRPRARQSRLAIQWACQASNGQSSMVLPVGAIPLQSQQQHQPLHEPHLGGDTSSAATSMGPEHDWEPLNGLTAVIVGAGPAGCTLAMHLAKAGWRVRIYEKRPEPGPVTSSRQRSWVLAMYPRGIRPVKAVAEVPLLRERAYKGLVVGAGKPGSKPIVLERTGVLMDRTLLATSLLDAARGQYGSRLEFTFSSSLEAVDFPHRVASFRGGSSDSDNTTGDSDTPTTNLVGATASCAPTGSAALAAEAAAHAAAGSRGGGAPQAAAPLLEVPYDLLVGADGSSSTLRTLLSESFPGRYETTVLGGPGAAGSSCYKSVYGLPPVHQAEAWAPDSSVPASERLQGEFFFALSGGDKGFISVCRDIDGSYCGYLAARKELFAEMHTREDYMVLLPQVCPQLPAEWLPMLGEKLLTAPLSNFPLMRSLPSFWAPGGVVLVGDAAHTVTPSLGQGLNSALEDCELLVEQLRKEAVSRESAGGIDTALRRYSESRAPNVRALQELELLQSSALTPLSSARGEPLFLIQLLVRKWIIIQYSGLALLGTIVATAQAANRKTQQQQLQHGAQQLGRGGDLQVNGGKGSSMVHDADRSGVTTDADAEAAARADILGRQLDATYVRSPPMYELLRGHLPYQEMLVRVYGMAALGTGFSAALLCALCGAFSSWAARVISG